MAPQNPEIQGLMNLFRQFITSQRGSGGGLHPFGGAKGAGGGGTDVPESWLDEQKEILKSHTDSFRKVTEDHNKGFKSVADEFWSKGIKMEAFSALPQAIIRETLKYSFFQGYQIQGGSAGESARGSLERLNSAGTVLSIAAGSLLTLATGGTGLLGWGGAAAMGGAVSGGLMGTGLGTRIAAASRAAQEVTVDAAVKRQFLEAGERKTLGYEQALMVNLMGARTGAYAANVGGAGPVMDPEMIKRTLLSKQEFTMAWAEAARVGGGRGMDELSRDMRGKGTIARMWEQGLTGPDFAQTMMMAATAGRYGIGTGGFEAMTRRTGMQPSEWLGAAMQAQTRYFMFGANKGQALAYGVGGTDLGRMNLGAGMGFLQQMGQGSAGQGDEAVSMLQFRSFMQANPGSNYLDFLEAKRNGEADPKWIATMAQMTGEGGGGQLARITAGVKMGLAPGQVGNANRFLRQMSRGGNVATGQAGVPADLAAYRDVVGNQLARQGYEMSDKQLLMLKDHAATLDKINTSQNDAIKKMERYNDVVIKGTDNLNVLNDSFFKMIDNWAVRMYSESDSNRSVDNFVTP